MNLDDKGYCVTLIDDGRSLRVKYHVHRFVGEEPVHTMDYEGICAAGKTFTECSRNIKERIRQYQTEVENAAH